jgi:peroxiredoxin
VHAEERIVRGSKLMNRTWTALWIFASLLLAASCRSGGGSVTSERSAFDSSSAHPSTENASASAPATGPALTQKIPGKAELGQPVPDFTLADVNGKAVTLSQFRGRTVVLEWFNPRCPYCQDAYREGGVLREMPDRWAREGVVWLSINSQAASEAGSDPEENKVFMREHEMRMTLLMDPSGVVGKAFGAKSTPHVFVVNEKGWLVYRGALDNAPHGVVPPEEAKTNYVDAALRDLKSGHAVMIGETKPYG